MKFVNERIVVGDSADGRNEKTLMSAQISACLNVAIDLDLVNYSKIISQKAGLICGPGNTLDMIDSAVKKGIQLLRLHERILIFCHSGYERSPLIAAMVFSEVERISFDKAWKIVKDTLGNVSFPSPEVESALLEIVQRWVKQRGYGQHLVSIIMPCYRQADVTRRCLKSIRRNTVYRPYEIVAVNDGSGDDGKLCALLDEYCDRVITHPENEGIAKSRADGTRAATGDIICHIDNDTVFFPDWLTPLLETLRSVENVAIVAPLFTLNMHYFAERIDDLDENNCFEVAEVGSACMLFFKELINQIGNFNPDLYNLWEDKDFCYRVSRRDPKLPKLERHRIVHDARVAVYHAGYVDPKTGEWAATKSTRSLSELQKHDRIAKSVRITFEQWGIKHGEYDIYNPPEKAQ